MTAFIAKVTVMERRTSAITLKVPLAPTKLYMDRIRWSPETPNRVAVMVDFKTLNIREMAADAGNLKAPKALSRTILSTTIFRKSSTILRQSNTLGRKTLPWVILTTFLEK